MEVKVEKLTGEKVMREACSVTRHGKPSEVSLEEIYKSEHSPMRTQVFWVNLLGIYSFVSTHIVRHNVGVEHFVSSLRDDTFGSGDEGRYTLVDHAMFVNAQALVNMARKRLCFKAHEETRKVFLNLKREIMDIDSPLSRFLVPECVYRGGICPERKPCKIREDGGLAAIKRNTLG